MVRSECLKCVGTAGREETPCINDCDAYSHTKLSKGMGVIMNRIEIQIEGLEFFLFLFFF